MRKVQREATFHKNRDFAHYFFVEIPRFPHSSGAPEVTIFERAPNMEDGGAVGKSLSFVLLAMEAVFIAAFAWKGEYGTTVGPVFVNKTYAHAELSGTFKVQEYYTSEFFWVLADKSCKLSACAGSRNGGYS